MHTHIYDKAMKIWFILFSKDFSIKVTRNFKKLIIGLFLMKGQVLHNLENKPNAAQNNLFCMIQSTQKQGRFFQTLSSSFGSIFFFTNNVFFPPWFFSLKYNNV